MKIIYEKIFGDYVVQEDLILHGMIIGSVYILDNVKLILHGMINGEINISPSAKLIAFGTVNGNIVNSGYCQVFGIVKGEIINNNGDLIIEPNSKINPL